MNAIAKAKIETIGKNLHLFARHECLKYLSAAPCEDCDIECPFDTIDNLLSKIQRGNKTA